MSLFKARLSSTEEGWGSGDYIVSFGTTSFSGYDQSVEVTLYCNIVDACLLTIRDATPIAADMLSHDGTISSRALTVYRVAGETSGLEFDYIAVGHIGLTSTA